LRQVPPEFSMAQANLFAPLHAVAPASRRLRCADTVACLEHEENSVTFGLANAESAAAVPEGTALTIVGFEFGDALQFLRYVRFSQVSRRRFCRR
jgi:hypothetical protein